MKIMHSCHLKRAHPCQLALFASCRFTCKAGHMSAGHAGNLNGGLGGADNDSSDWEEASEEGSESDALEVHGLPPGQDLLDIAAAAASAHDYVNGTKVRFSIRLWH